MAEIFSRVTRVEQQIARRLAILLGRYTDEPRLRLVSITRVRVSRDLRHAKVYVSSFDNTLTIDALIELLNNAKFRLRHQLASVLSLKRLPELNFIYDADMAQQIRVDELVDAAVEKAFKN